MIEARLNPHDLKLHEVSAPRSWDHHHTQSLEHNHFHESGENLTTGVFIETINVITSLIDNRIEITNKTKDVYQKPFQMLGYFYPDPRYRSEEEIKTNTYLDRQFQLALKEKRESLKEKDAEGIAENLLLLCSIPFGPNQRIKTRQNIQLLLKKIAKVEQPEGNSLSYTFIFEDGSRKQIPYHELRMIHAQKMAEEALKNPHQDSYNRDHVLSQVNNTHNETAAQKVADTLSKHGITFCNFRNSDNEFVQENRYIIPAGHNAECFNNQIESGTAEREFSHPFGEKGLINHGDLKVVGEELKEDLCSEHLSVATLLLLEVHENFLEETYGDESLLQVKELSGEYHPLFYTFENSGPIIQTNYISSVASESGTKSPPVTPSPSKHLSRNEAEIQKEVTINVVQKQTIDEESLFSREGSEKSKNDNTSAETLKQSDVLPTQSSTVKVIKKKLTKRNNHGQKKKITKLTKKQLENNFAGKNTSQDSEGRQEKNIKKVERKTAPIQSSEEKLEYPKKEGRPEKRETNNSDLVDNNTSIEKHNQKAMRHKAHAGVSQIILDGASKPTLPIMFPIIEFGWNGESNSPHFLSDNKVFLSVLIPCVEKVDIKTGSRLADAFSQKDEQLSLKSPMEGVRSNNSIIKDKSVTYSKNQQTSEEDVAASTERENNNATVKLYDKKPARKEQTKTKGKYENKVKEKDKRSKTLQDITVNTLQTGQNTNTITVTDVIAQTANEKMSDRYSFVGDKNPKADAQKKGDIEENITIQPKERTIQNQFTASQPSTDPTPIKETSGIRKKNQTETLSLSLQIDGEFLNMNDPHNIRHLFTQNLRKYSAA